jgi:hypothetical protein
MPVGQLTVTAKSGPAQQSTAKVISNVTGYTVDLMNRVIHVSTSDSPLVQDYDLVGVTTFTTTITGATYALVIS